MNFHKFLFIFITASVLTLGTFLLFRNYVHADSNPATNISFVPGQFWAWNDVIGWIDFHNTHTVRVSDAQLTGYASSSAGDISLDCATTRAGNICGQSNYRVLNDNAGNLSGWGWNDVFGWISFCGGQNTVSCPGSVAYRVLIQANGDFYHYAWNDAAGWISFNCVNPGICGTSNYKVNTSWTPTPFTASVDSEIFDTGVAGGAQLNSVLWQGLEPAGTAVRFQFAGSNAVSGPWNFIGSDGTGNTYYQVNPATTLRLSYTLHNNQRYFRYRVTLLSDLARTTTPRVDDILVNWSP